MQTHEPPRCTVGRGGASAPDCVLSRGESLSLGDLLDDVMAGRDGRELELRAIQVGIQPTIAHELAVVTARDLGFADRIVRQQVLLRRVPHFAHLRQTDLVIIAQAGPALFDALSRAATMSAFSGGVSLPFTGAGNLRRAYDEAFETLALARPGQVQRLTDLRLFDYLVSRPTPIARRLVPEGLPTLDRVHRQTLVAFAECDLNAERAARRLHVHTNTVHYRLRKINELTGREVRRFTDLVELLAGVRVLGA